MNKMELRLQILIFLLLIAFIIIVIYLILNICSTFLTFQQAEISKSTAILH